jgi:RNA polymerase sigma-70 factor (ECF subfamily)
MGFACVEDRRRLPSSPVGDERDLVDRLQAGDEAAFAELVQLYQLRLLRLAQSVVSSRTIAEEVVQDTWLAVVKGVERFEGRSTLKTWLFHILLNRARTTAARERRIVSLPDGEIGERFDAGGAWVTPPVPWAERTDDRLAAEHLAARIRDMVPTLPEGQREVVILRDLEGLPAPEVCALLGISDGNQRVLLHRGRAHLRRSIESEMQS